MEYRFIISEEDADTRLDVFLSLISPHGMLELTAVFVADQRTLTVSSACFGATRNREI